ncbi:MAG: hypothetical protein C6Y22_09675 [Hapalosiphonaceae cyanobacterium JJU2]|nr:MAG: hypothetical protein C6Y22_09675 [Hapalosiphonaceae cyanobacterium JJU2]
MHNKSWKYVRTVILITLTVIATSSLSVSINIKTLAQISSVQSLEQRQQQEPQGAAVTSNIKDVITNSLTEKPPVICRILPIRNMLSWKCPVHNQGNGSVQTPVNIPQEEVRK